LMHPDKRVLQPTRHLTIQHIYVRIRTHEYEKPTEHPCQ
jgi:hypothetical protein